MNAIAVVREAILAQLEALKVKDNQLKEEQRNLDQRTKEEQRKLDQRTADLEKERGPLIAALKEVTSGKPDRSSGRGKSRKPSLKKKDVYPVCLALVQANPGITNVELKELAKDKLGNELGFDLKGVDLRIKECLSSDDFMVTAEGLVSLCSREPVSAEVVATRPLPGMAITSAE